MKKLLVALMALCAWTATMSQKAFGNTSALLWTNIRASRGNSSLAMPTTQDIPLREQLRVLREFRSRKINAELCLEEKTDYRAISSKIDIFRNSTTAPFALALSDRTYSAMLKSSPEFRQAENVLADVWKRARLKLKGSEGMAWRELRDSQRDWIASGRDEKARLYIEQGMRQDEAYAKVTQERAAYLERFTQ